MQRKCNRYITCHGFLFLAAAVIFGNAVASPQMLLAEIPPESPIDSVCHERSVDAHAIAALRLVCQQGPIAHTGLTSGEPIVIGFVGGFVSAGK